MKALAPTNQKLWPRSKFSKSRSNSRVRGWRSWYQMKGLTISNTHVKYKTLSTYKSKVITKVKVLLTDRWTNSDWYRAPVISGFGKLERRPKDSKNILFQLQVTLDNSNFDLSKWIPVPIFITYLLSISRTFDPTKFSISRSDFGSREINFIIFHSRSLAVIIHAFT
jgi:hypothetical protein